MDVPRLRAVVAVHGDVDASGGEGGATAGAQQLRVCRASDRRGVAGPAGGDDVVRRVGRRLREEAIWLILVAGVLMAASGTGQLLDAIWQSLGGR